MSSEKVVAAAPDPHTKQLYRAGGISGIVLGLSYIVIMALYAVGGAPPSGAEDWLRYLHGHTATWWTILGLSVLTDCLFVPVALSLYLVLKDVNRNAMLAGAGLLVSFVVLDLAVTWPNYSSLITLSGQFAAATSDAQGILGGLKSIIGGQIGAYAEMCEQTRQQAFDRLLEHATALGANAVVGLRYESSEVGSRQSSATEVLCYGTAVVVQLNR